MTNGLGTTFYSDEAELLPLLGSSGEALDRVGAKLLNLEEARAIPFQPLFLIADDDLALPISACTNIILPGGRTDHKRLVIDGKSLDRGSVYLT